jgi:hypothetical protein
MRHSFSSLLRFASVPVTIAGLITLSLPPQPATARQNDYQTCAAALRDSGIASAQIAAACAASLRPTELATCVNQISGQATIAATDALSGCRRVRRPLELATCVVSINPGEGAVATTIAAAACCPLVFQNVWWGCLLKLTSIPTERCEIALPPPIQNLMACRSRRAIQVLLHLSRLLLNLWCLRSVLISFHPHPPLQPSLNGRLKEKAADRRSAACLITKNPYR